jgi:hypothetical protein
LTRVFWAENAEKNAVAVNEEGKRDSLRDDKQNAKQRRVQANSRESEKERQACRTSAN